MFPGEIITPPSSPNRLSNIDAGLAHELADRISHELSREVGQHLGSGWDFDVWLFRDLAFRFPRRRAAIGALKTELRVLPILAARIGVCVPQPLLIGSPSEVFSAPYWAHRLLEGKTAEQVILSGNSEIRLAESLGAALRQIHRISKDDESLRLAVDVGRGDTLYNRRRAIEQLVRLRGTPHFGQETVLRHYLDLPPPSNRDHLVPVHGDLHSGHLVLAEDGSLSSILDWGGVCLGDAALDLSIVYTSLSDAGRERFWMEYGEVDQATRERARYLGLCRYGVRAYAHALGVGDGKLEHTARRTLALAYPK